MDLSVLNPWQLLLWIVLLMLLAAPIIIATVNAVFMGWYNVKEKYLLKLTSVYSKIAGAGAEALLKGMEALSKKKQTESKAGE